MNVVRICLLLGLHACATHAAEPPRPAEATGDITVLLGQWKFLNSSTALCLERTPALKEEIQSARTHAEAEMRKAEAIILQAVGDKRKSHQRYIDLYVEMWSRHAGELAESMKRQDPVKACPVLLANWQAADADLVLEDWQGFLDRYMSLQPEEAR